MEIKQITQSTILADTLSMYPSALSCHLAGTTSYPNETSNYFGFCVSGSVQLARENGYKVTICAGMYFSATGSISIDGKGEVFVVERMGYRGLFAVGGPVENEGRLIYIDNCRSTILVPPARLSDPVLNLLTFPPNTNQTMHIHPTVRLGGVFCGSGICVTPNSTHSLAPGTVFKIEAGEQHAFRTANQSMTVIAFHPDSDVGPTDISHPMLSRTYFVGGR